MEVVRSAPSPPPPPPPLPDNFEKDEADPNVLYIIGKRIYQRLRFILDIEKYFAFATLWAFWRNAPQWLQNGCLEKNQSNF